MQASSRDAADLDRILDIGRQRSLHPYVHDSTLTESKALPTEVTMDFGGTKSHAPLQRLRRQELASSLETPSRVLA